MERGRQAVEAFGRLRANLKTDPEAAAEARRQFDENVAYFGYGYIPHPDKLVPNIPIVYWSFRVMVGAGMALLLVLILVLWHERRGRLEHQRWLLHLGVWSILLVYAAGQAGWIVAEVGRQPWGIQDMLPVGAAVSQLEPASVQTTFVIFALLFTALLAAEIRIMCRAIHQGPEEKGE